MKRFRKWINYDRRKGSSDIGLENIVRSLLFQEGQWDHLMLLCFNPAGSQAPLSCLLTCPTSQWDEGENWGKKSKWNSWVEIKTIYQDREKEAEKKGNGYDNYIYMCNKWCTIAHHQSPASPQAASGLPVNSPFFKLSFRMMSYIMEYPFGQFMSAVLILSPPSSLGPPALWLAEQ